MKRSSAFLMASFLSAFGDALLVCAVPYGLGAERDDVRFAVIMWLFPAVAIYTASLFARFVKKRVNSARLDYGLILLTVAAIELMFAWLLADKGLTSNQLLLFSSAFVVLYAFTKEGIPRIFYNVSVYKYFFSEADYAKAAGLKSSLDILAYALGGLTAAYLISNSTWRLAFAIDAATFIGLGLVLIFFGRQESSDEGKLDISVSCVSTSTPMNRGLAQALGPFLVIPSAVAILYGISGVGGNYTPLIAERFGISSAALGVALLILCRLPGMLVGLKIQPIISKLGPSRIVSGVPILSMSAVFLFFLWPSKLTLVLSFVMSGIVIGLFNPADMVLRNSLPRDSLFQLNSYATKVLAISQFAGCMLAMVAFSGFFSVEPRLIIATLVPVLGLIFYFLPKIIVRILYSKQDGFSSGHRLTFLPSIPLALMVCLIVFLGLAIGPQKNEKHFVTAILPSLNQDLRLQKDLTYSAFIVLNDTSAHLLRVGRSLTAEGEIVKKFVRSADATEYTIFLDPSYRSARGEEITAEDVLYSMRWLVLNKRELVAPLAQISGVSSCSQPQCHLQGIEVIDKFVFKVRLENPDKNYVAKLASPWLIIIKKDKPETEVIGECQVPYQTGTAEIVHCQKGRIKLKFTENKLITLATSVDEKDAQVVRLVSDNNGQKPQGTLTSMTAFAHPRFADEAPHELLYFSNELRAKSAAMAERFGLRSSATFAPVWLGLKPENWEKRAVSKSCPRQPLRILLDNSLPSSGLIKSEIAKFYPCEAAFKTTNAENYFKDFEQTDIGFAWFTPDYLDFYSVFAPFDCSQQGFCYFNYKDTVLQGFIDKLRIANSEQKELTGLVRKIEERFFQTGMVTPVAEMSWWIVGPGSIRSAHPAGLFQLHAGDFLQ
jgi:hypothetical protein